MDNAYSDKLLSSSPHERAAAINWLRQNPSSITIEVLMNALQRESIPRLRRGLDEIIASRDNQTVKPQVNKASLEGKADTQDVFDVDLAGIIRHELSPAVGWIRLAANDEVQDFNSSRTNKAVRQLQKRIDGLITLVKATAPLDVSRIVLREALVDNWPVSTEGPTMRPEVGQSAMEIETDTGLFYLILANAYQNAIDASVEATGRAAVDVSWGRLEDQFWVRITNPFAANGFTFESVVGAGSSSKASHQGKGLALMRTAASRLGMSFHVSGSSGLATARLSGRIRVG